ncbi:MAG: hypothetical protein U1F60_13930 [Planctomycetota bacterium]
MRFSPCFAVGFCVATLSAQQNLVVPAAYTTNDSISYEWVAGASRQLRQQTLIGPSHLAGMYGHPIMALELRRTAANETYLGGSTQWTVHLSHAPHEPIEASNVYAANVGADAVQVFQGEVTLPTSPPALGPSVAWTSENTIRIEFDTPFVYLGGTLCVDVVGEPVSGQNANWWMADAAFESVAGTTLDLGGGCGSYGGPQHQWANIATRSLLPGGYARFFAFGTPYTMAVIVLGQRSMVPTPLSVFGYPSPPECLVHLATFDAVAFLTFEPESMSGLLSRGGIAEARMKLPNNPLVLGAGMTTQWLEYPTAVTSNAIEWAVSTAPSALDMSLLEGSPQEATGELSVHLAHVMRFEFL